MNRYSILAVSVCALLVGGQAQAEDYTWTGGANDWDALSQWQDSAGGNPSSTAVFEGTDDTFTAAAATGGTLWADGSPVFAALLTIEGNGDPDAYDGATLLVDDEPEVMDARDCHLDGGRLYLSQTGGGQYQNGSISANTVITVDGSAFFDGTNLRGGRGCNMNGAIAGSGVIAVDMTPGFFRLNGAGTYTGQWTLLAGRLEGYASGALGTGSVVVNGGSLRTKGDHSGLVRIEVNAGTLQVDGHTTLSDVHMTGGALVGGGDNYTLTIGAGEFLWIDADTDIQGSTSAGKQFTIAAEINGTHKLTVTDQTTGTAYVNFNADSRATFSGEVEANDCAVSYDTTGAMGTGTVTVNGSTFRVRSTIAGNPLITLDGGSTLYPSGNCNIGNVLHMNGGTLYYAGGNGSMSGDLYIDGDIRWAPNANDPGKNFYIYAPFHGSSGITVAFVNSPPRSRLAADNRATFSGPWSFQRGTVYLNSAGALGTGPVEVYADARLITESDGSMDGPAEVNVNTDGIVVFDSTESIPVNLTFGAALRHAGGDTTYTFSGEGQNVALTPGCILDSLPTDPSYEEVSALSGGDGLFGLYRGYGANTSVAGGTFGDDGSSNIWRGLAADNYATLTVTGTCDESVGSTQGVMFYAQRGSTLKFDHTAKGARLDPNPGNPVRLDGGGNFQFVGTATGSFTTVEKKGTGIVTIVNDGGLSGRTLNVHGGLAAFGTGAAPDGAAINCGPGGGVKLDVDISDTTGAITLSNSADAGNVVQIVNNDGLLSAANKLTFPATGALGKIVLTPLDNHGLESGTKLAGGGRADVLIATTLWFSWPGGGVEVGNGSRITVGADSVGNPIMPAYGQVQRGGAVTVAPGADPVARICAPDGRTLDIWPAIDLGADGTLIVGDTQSYDTIVPDSTLTVAISQDGVVIPNNLTAGAVDVQAGTLSAGGGNFTHILKASTQRINIAGGTNLTASWANSRVYCTFSGEGLINPTYGALPLRSTDDWHAGVSPGDNWGEEVGILTADFGNGSGFSFEMYGEKPCRFAADIVDHGGVPGEDHDQLFMLTSSLSNLNNAELELTLPLPSGELSPTALKETDMVLIAASSVSGSSFFDVIISGRTDSHWGLVEEKGPAVEVVDREGGGKNVVLHGAALEWTGLGGDADLNGVVNYLDLGVLATNYDFSGMGWDDGEFTFDGKVDYMDLGILATNYDLTESSGAAAVPEPAFAVLLSVSVIGVLRRRRQR